MRPLSKSLLLPSIAGFLTLLLMFAVVRAASTLEGTNLSAIVSSGKLVFTNPFPEPNGTDSNIWIANIDGSSPVSVTTYSNTDRYPSISPGGDKIAYMSWVSNKWVFHVVTIQGGNLITMPLAADSQKAAWSPSGDRLAFSNVGSGGWQVWVIDANGANAHQATTNLGSAGEPSWSPDGLQIVYAVQSSLGYHDLYTVTPDGINQTLLLGAGGSYSNLDPAWSPDGAEIAFIRYPAGNYGGTHELWIMNSDTTNKRMLTCCVEPGGFNGPSWTIDSQQIYIGKSGNIWRIDRDGQHLAQITTGGGWEPSVSGARFVGTPMAYLPVVIVPIKTPTPTPSPTPIVFPGIAGRVTLNGSGVGGVPLELRFYNGSSFSTRAAAMTSSNGSFDFTGQPSLGSNQAYYVRYRNSTDGTRLGYWATRLLTSYSAGTLVFIGDFDIQDIVMLNPVAGANITFPYLFQWVSRTSTTSDSYQVTFYDPNNVNTMVQTQQLGYVSSANIGPLPAGFNPGQTYDWEVWANEPDSAFGVSFAARPFSFSANAAHATGEPGISKFADANRDIRLTDLGIRP